MVIVALCAGGYYQYTLIQKGLKEQKDLEAQIAADRQQIGNLNTAFDQLQSEKKKTEDEKTQLTKNLDVAEGVIADLNNQVQTAQSALEDTKKQLTAALNKPPPPQTDDLGTLTVEGKTFLDCQLIRVDPDGIVIKHSTGIVKILSPGISPDLQVRFGYNLVPPAPILDAHTLIQPVPSNTIKAIGN